MPSGDEDMKMKKYDKLNEKTKGETKNGEVKLFQKEIIV